MSCFKTKTSGDQAPMPTTVPPPYNPYYQPPIIAPTMMYPVPNVTQHSTVHMPQQQPQQVISSIRVKAPEEGCCCCCCRCPFWVCGLMLVLFLVGLYCAIPTRGFHWYIRSYINIFIYIDMWQVTLSLRDKPRQPHRHIYTYIYTHILTNIYSQWHRSSMTS